ncbi:GNAT family N-acetyltransferase [Lentzea sp. NPDC051838]|uniref:GNAT family N-acetyltransferase n=1 Tax=Lentzea sp. NPDC051838 TaxID=3154849 RepID=UPI003438FE93
MRELTWRPLTRDDAQASADLLNAIEVVDQIGENYTAEDTLTELVDPSADLERASLCAFDGDVMVGYMKVRHKPSASVVHRVIVDGGVHPSYRRRGIGSRLLEAGIAAAQVVHALHHPGLQLVVEMLKAEKIAGLSELASSLGFAPVRYYQRMEHPLDSLPRVAEDLRIEAWTAENDEDFRFVRNEAYADYWGTAPMPADLWQNKITNQTFRPAASFLLRDGGGAPVSVLVTMHWEADTSYTGIRDAHFMVIGTRPSYRQQGFASALIGYALAAVAVQGYDRASLSVESAAEAPRFFEKAGFEPKMRYVRWALPTSH